MQNISIISDPLLCFYQQLHNHPVVLRGIRGRVVIADDDLYFYPDETDPGYLADIAKLGGAWSRWYISDDISALAAAASQVGLSSMVIPLPADDDIPEFAQFIEGLLVQMGLD